MPRAKYDIRREHARHLEPATMAVVMVDGGYWTTARAHKNAVLLHSPHCVVLCCDFLAFSHDQKRASTTACVVIIVWPVGGRYLRNELLLPKGKGPPPTLLV